MQIHVNMYVAMQNVDGYFISRQEASFYNCYPLVFIVLEKTSIGNLAVIENYLIWVGFEYITY